MASPAEQTISRLRLNIYLVQALQVVSYLHFSVSLATPYYRSRGLNEDAISTLQTLFAISVVVFGVAGGAIADRYSKRWCLGWGIFIMGGSYIAMAFSPGFMSLAICQLALGFGTGIVRDSDVSLARDSLGELSKLDEPVRSTEAAHEFNSFMAQRIIYIGLAEAFASLVTTARYAIVADEISASRLAFEDQGTLLAVLGGIAVLLMVNATRPPSATQAPSSHWFIRAVQHILETMLQSVKEVFRTPKLWRLVLAQATLVGCIAMVQPWLMQYYFAKEMHFGALGFTLSWVAYNLFFTGAGYVILRLLSRGVSWWGIFAPVLPIVLVSYLLLGYTGGWIGMVAFAALYVVRAIAMIILPGQISSVSTAHRFTTILSVTSLVQYTGFIVSNKLLSHIAATHNSMQPSFRAALLGIGTLTIIVVALLWPYRKTT